MQRHLGIVMVKCVKAFGEIRISLVMECKCINTRWSVLFKEKLQCQYDTRSEKYEVDNLFKGDSGWQMYCKGNHGNHYDDEGLSNRLMRDNLEMKIPEFRRYDNEEMTIFLGCKKKKKKRIQSTIYLLQEFRFKHHYII